MVNNGYLENLPGFWDSDALQALGKCLVMFCTEFVCFEKYCYDYEPDQRRLED